MWIHGLKHTRLLCPLMSPVVFSDSFQFSHPLLFLLLLPSIFPIIRVLSTESVLCIRWPKYWSFNFSISLSNEYSGLISFRIDWSDILAVQRTLRSLLQHPSLKVSIFWPSILDLCSEWNSTSECPRTASSNWKQRAHDLLFVGFYLLAFTCWLLTEGWFQLLKMRLNVR